MSSPTSQIVVHHIMRATRVCRPPHPNGILSSTMQTGWALFSINTTPYKSVRMQTINISERKRSQSTHKVPKRRRLAPSWDVVDDRPPHQLVHGERITTGFYIEISAYKDKVHSLRALIHRTSNGQPTDTISSPPDTYFQSVIRPFIQSVTVGQRFKCGKGNCVV